MPTCSRCGVSWNGSHGCTVFTPFRLAAARALRGIAVEPIVIRVPLWAALLAAAAGLFWALR